MAELNKMVKAWFSKKPARKDTRLNKACQLFMSVEREHGIVMYAGKGLLNNVGGWGTLDYHLNYRLNVVKKEFNFVPDEIMFVWTFDDIDKTPLIDTGYKAFAKFLSGYKASHSFSLRKYAFMQDKNISEKEQFPEDEFKNWCRIEDTRRIKNSFEKDLALLDSLLQKEELDQNLLGQLKIGLHIYLNEKEALINILQKIELHKDISRKVEIYGAIEEIVKKAPYYAEQQVENIEYMKRMPVEEMNPIHALALEYLCSNDDYEGNFLERLQKVLGNKDLLIFKIKILLYHNLTGNYSMEEESQLMDLEKNGNVKFLKEIKRLGYANMVGVKANPLMYILGTPSEDSPEVPHPESEQAELTEAVDSPDKQDSDIQGTAPNEEEKEVKQLKEKKQETVQAENKEVKVQAEGKNGFRMTGLEQQGRLAELGAGKKSFFEQLGFKEKDNDSLDHAENTRMHQTVNVQEDIRDTLDKLQQGSPLRLEIDRFKNCPEITKAQLDWIFKQPYFSVDNLISSGVMVSNIMQTNFFKALTGRLDQHVKGSSMDLSDVEDMLLTAYARILAEDIRNYDMLAKPDQNNRPFIESMKIKSIIDDSKLVLQTIESVLDIRREERNEAMRMDEIEKVKSLLTVVYDGAVSEGAKKETAEKLRISLLHWKNDKLYIKYIAKHMTELNLTGKASYMYSFLSVLPSLPEFYGEEIQYNSPDTWPVIDERVVNWYCLLLAVAYHGFMLNELGEDEKSRLQTVESVMNYFKQNGKSVPAWILRDCQFCQLNLLEHQTKTDVYKKAVGFMMDVFMGKEHEAAFDIQKELQLSLEEIRSKREEWVKKNVGKKTRQKVRQMPSESEVNQDRTEPEPLKEAELSRHTNGNEQASDVIPGMNEDVCEVARMNKNEREELPEGDNNQKSTPETKEESSAEGEDGDDDKQISICYAIQRDGIRKNPLSFLWTWEDAHLHDLLPNTVIGELDMMGGEDKEKGVEQGEELLKILCLSCESAFNYYNTYIINRESKEQFCNKIINNYRICIEQHKEWRDSEDKYVQALYIHMDKLAGLFEKIINGEIASVSID